MTDDAIVAAIIRAQSAWTGLDWPTDTRGPDGEPPPPHAYQRVIDLDDDERTVAVRIPDWYDETTAADLPEPYRALALAYVAEVEDSANMASHEGDLAIVAIRRGDLPAALEHVERACDIEREYGDDTVWGRVRADVDCEIDDRGVEK